eukprot:CAMPEP_0183728736 /NCGR_PEP_ID=MMETSP0737-20130205/28786_1 /TAXON_ID=385413 /ORGANISM="Thalassiosira miniscula, Strain CCMP1093" /LENGTH=74 /DNA_ID=CAMNT_0025960757 /DNA_START=109 /DNA_END=330 /DNA_ORIENTATION=+
MVAAVEVAVARFVSPMGFVAVAVVAIAFAVAAAVAAPGMDLLELLRDLLEPLWHWGHYQIVYSAAAAAAAAAVV